MTTPQDRIQLVDSPVSSPGKCAICGSVGGADDRKFLDWGWDLDWYGVVYFCTYCMSDLAKASDLFVGKAEYNELSLQHFELEEENKRLKETVRGLKDVLSGLGIDFDGIITRDIVSVPLEDDVPEPEESASSDRSIADAEGSKSKSNKSSSSKEHRSSGSTEPDNFGASDSGEISLGDLL